MKGMAMVRVTGKGGIAEIQGPLIANTLGIAISWLQSWLTARQVWPNLVLRLHPTLPALSGRRAGLPLLIHHLCAWNKGISCSIMA